jgi:hypothetical protein
VVDAPNQDFGSAVLAHEKESWDQTPPDFKFLPSDLMPLAASIKHMNLIGPDPSHITANSKNNSQRLRTNRYRRSQRHVLRQLGRKGQRSSAPSDPGPRQVPGSYPIPHYLYFSFFVLFLIPLQFLPQIAARKMPFIDADTVVALGDMLVSRAKECKAAPHRRYRTFVAANGAC